MIALARVDFPEPFGPISACISPRSTTRSTPRRMSCSPARTWRFRISRSAIPKLSLGEPVSGRLHELAPAGELDELSQRGRLQRADDSALDTRPQQLGGASAARIRLV